jgi:hypothetical protein
MGGGEMNFIKEAFDSNYVALLAQWSMHIQPVSGLGRMTHGARLEGKGT